jgi:hypothetical protein
VAVVAQIEELLYRSRLRRPVLRLQQSRETFDEAATGVRPGQRIAAGNLDARPDKRQSIARVVARNAK